MSVQVGYTKQVLFGIMFLLIIIVVVEGFAKVWWYQLESCAFEDSDVYDGVSPETKRQMCVESYQLRISEDGIDPNQDFQTMNINSHGFRGTEISIEKPENTFRIFGVGGSTMMGSGSLSDVTTITGFLQNEFDKQNLQYDVEVINAGQSGAWSHTEVNLIKTKLLRFNPDLFIIYDGWNDASAGGWTENNENAKEIVSNWVSRWSEICIQGKENNFKTVIFVQPILGTSERTLSEQEFSNFLEINDTNLKRLGFFADALDELKTVCDGTVDLRNAFDGIDVPIYWDAGHMANTGNKIISKKMFQVIFPLIVDDKNNEFTSFDEQNRILGNTTVKTSISFEDDHFSNMDTNLDDSEIVSQTTKDFTVKLKRIILENYKTPYVIQQLFVGAEDKLVTQQFVKGENVKTISDIDFSNLSNIDLSKGYFPNIDLSNKNLSKSNFSGAYLKNSNFKNSELFETKFAFTNMMGTDLSFAELEYADFQNSDMLGSVLSNSNLKYANFDNTRLNNVNFRDSNLSNVDLSHANLRGVDFQGANMEFVNLEGQDLRRCFFMNTNLSNANLHGTYIETAYLKNAKLNGVDLSSATFTSTQFSGWDFTNVNFSSSPLYDADFSNSNLTGVDFSNSNLSNANFENSNLEDALGGPFIGCKNHHLCK